MKLEFCLFLLYVKSKCMYEEMVKTIHRSVKIDMDMDILRGFEYFRTF